jgi:hypothetical protein
MEIFQRAQKENADWPRRKVDFSVGDSVMITTKTWELERPSRNLSDQWRGLDTGKYRKYLPSRSTKSIENPSSLRPRETTQGNEVRTTPSQIEEPPPPIKIDGGREMGG